MNQEIKARYRNKLKKVIIEVWNGEKWVYVKTLSDPLTEFRDECLAKVSPKNPILEEKQFQKFAQFSLSELSQKDTSILEQAKKAQEDALKFIPPKKKLTDAEIKQLEEMTK